MHKGMIRFLVQARATSPVDGGEAGVTQGVTCGRPHRGMAAPSACPWPHRGRPCLALPGGALRGPSRARHCGPPPRSP